MTTLNESTDTLQQLQHFVGVVEDRNDPLSLGRCRVRAFGIHTEDKAMIPTEDLPWATPVMPFNSITGRFLCLRILLKSRHPKS